VPAQERLWRHDQAAPAAIGKHPGQRGEERAIDGPKTWPRLLPTQHHQLMPQNQQLDVLGELAAPPVYEQLQECGERAIEEGEDHLPMLSDPSTPISGPEPSFETPQDRRQAAAVVDAA
jgi:hypothetical protein